MVLADVLYKIVRVIAALSSFKFISIMGLEFHIVSRSYIWQKFKDTNGFHTF